MIWGFVEMKNSKLKHSISLIISSLLVSMIFGVIAWIVSNALDKEFVDVLFYISIGLIIIGSLTMMKGNPSGASLTGLGRNNAQYIANETLEAVKSQQESTKYHKDFKKHSVVELSFRGIALVLGGGILVLYNIMFF